MNNTNDNEPIKPTLDKGGVSGSVMDNFISKFEINRNILKEDGYPLVQENNDYITLE